MIEPKFTPGPWNLQELPDDNDGEPETCYRITGRSTLFLTVAPCSDGFVFGQNEANARLISAAPDLFAALHKLEYSVGHLGTECPSCGGFDPTRHSPADRPYWETYTIGHRPDCEIGAAIAKATGGEETR